MPRSFVPFAVTVCGIEELPGHCDVGVSHVLSILDPDHPELEAFGRYGEHERLELRFHDIIEPRDGLVPPQREHVEAILELGRDLMAEPEACRHLLVHCHMGISRSTAALTMLLAQARPDRPAADAVQGGEVAEILHDAEVEVERRLLEHHAHVAQRRHRIARQVVAQHAHAARLRLQEAGGDGEQRRLAGPVRAQQRGEAAGLHGEAHAVQRGPALVGEAHVLHGQGGTGHVRVQWRLPTGSGRP